jgi:predicted RNA methylase
LADDELQELADDIAANGLRNPIVMLDGRILDGRNRYIACKLARVEPRFTEFDGDDPIGWVVSQNLVRRHLTASQRAVVGFDMLPLMEKEAKQRQRRSNSYRDNGRLAPNGANRDSKGKASEIAARITKSSARHVERVKAVSQTAPELLVMIRAGNLTVTNATKLASLSAQERNKVLRLANGHSLTSSTIKSLTTEVRNQSRVRSAQRYAKSNKAGRGQNIIVGDMSILWKRLKDNSVDLFLSDPPYGQAKSYERLAELAAAKLKPGGLCLAYTGQLYLPANMAAMSKHLDYWWLFAVQFSGQQNAIHARHLQNCWKPILAFAKPSVRPAPAWLRDSLAGGGRDKDFHEWGKHESEASYLIQRLTEPGALVVDAYCGGGMVPAACKATGRRWMATEIDETTAKTTRKRLADMDRRGG